MGKGTHMDWCDCDLVERVPGKMGGRPAIIKGYADRARHDRDRF